MLFYLDPLQNQAIVTSRCMHYLFCRGREVKHFDVSVLPVMKKGGREKENEASALGWKMDVQTCVRFVLKHTVEVTIAWFSRGSNSVIIKIIFIKMY